MNKIFLLSMALSLLATSFSSHAAKWEQILSQPATNAFYIAKNGNMLLADFMFDGTGGIYLSEDNGETWEKTPAPDYTYNIFIENDDYIFAAGAMANIGRSADGGKTWETVSYARAFGEVMDPEYADYTICYAMEIHNGKLFIGDFSGAGVMYSEDNGETWINTDIQSLKYGEEDPKLGDRQTEAIYNLVSYNGNLYAFGVYFVFRLNEETMTWETLRNDSNFMGISAIYKDKLCCGRGVMSQTFDIPFIVTLDNEGQWGELPRPEGFIDNNIRAMHADGDNLYVGMQMTGIFFTDNEGENWHYISDGLPSYTYGEGDAANTIYDAPLNIKTDDEYVYLAMYRNPYSEGAEASGLYRMKKSELPSSGIKSINSNSLRVSKSGDSLIFNSDVDCISLYDMNGRKVNTISSSNAIDISNLPSGVYIYRVIVNDVAQTGKVVK